MAKSILARGKTSLLLVLETHRLNLIWLGSLFNGTSTFVGYLIVEKQH